MPIDPKVTSASLLTFLALSFGASLTLSANEYKVRYSYDQQGSYKVKCSGQDRSIRFVRLEYEGPASPKLWDEAFSKVARAFDKKDITAKKQSNGEFTKTKGLHNFRHQIVGWCSETTGKYGFVVVTRIEGDKVHYFDSQSKKFWRIGTNPNNFIKWHIGSEAGDWVGHETYAAIQLWKHKDQIDPHAAYSMRLLKKSVGSNPYK